MGLTITDCLMRGTITRHTAAREGGGWRVSWLPDRILDRNQAITAMTIAEHAGCGADGPLWVTIETWAAELGLTAADAVSLASGPPPETAR